jgi:hypothetical protein
VRCIRPVPRECLDDRLAGQLSSGDDGTQALALRDVMSMMKGGADPGAIRQAPADAFSVLPDRAARNILFFLSPRELGMMAQANRKISRMVKKFRPWLFRVHAYRLLFDCEGAMPSPDQLREVLTHRLPAPPAALPQAPVPQEEDEGVWEDEEGPDDVDDDDEPMEDVVDEAPAAVFEGVPGKPEPALVLPPRRTQQSLVPFWFMGSPVVAPSLLGAFLRVFGPFANTAKLCVERRPALSSEAPRAVEVAAWDALKRAWTDPDGLSFESMTSSSSAASSTSAVAAASSSSAKRGVRPRGGFPTTTEEPPIDPFVWWLTNRRSSPAGCRRSLMVLDLMQRLQLPMDDESWLRLTSYVVPDQNAEAQRTHPQQDSLPGLGGSHTFLEGSSSRTERPDALARGGSASSAKQLPFTTDFDHATVCGTSGMWLRFQFRPRFETLFAWSKPPHQSIWVTRVSSQLLNDTGVGWQDLIRTSFMVGMTGAQRRALGAAAAARAGQLAFEEVIARGGEEAEAQEAGTEAALSAPVEYSPWSASNAPISADLNMVGRASNGCFVAATLRLLGEEQTRAAGRLFRGNELAFIGTGVTEVVHSGKYGPDTSHGGPSTVSSGALLSNGIGDVTEAVVDVPIAALWHFVRLPHEREADDVVFENLRRSMTSSAST